MKRTRWLSVIALLLLTAASFPTRSLTAELIYELIAVHSGKCLSVYAESQYDNATVVQYDCVGRPNQRFYLHSYTSYDTALVPIHSEKCLSVYAESQANNADVVQYTCMARLNQRFYMRGVNGMHTLITLHSDKCLSVYAESQANNAAFVQYDCVGRPNQRFRLVQVPQ